MCTDCYNNCGGNVQSDQCVKYTGPDISFLNLETGDNLSQVEAAIIDALETALDGSGISFDDLSLCDSIDDALGTGDPTLKNIIQAFADVICQLRSDVDDLEDIVNAPTTFSAPCLTLGSNPTRDQVLQAAITKLCSISDSVDDILADYVKESELCDKVDECLDSGAVVQENTKMAKYVAVPYHGSLTVFDSQGKGLSSAGYDKIYICNGQTVGSFITPDYRGRSPIGVNSGLPGGTMDSNVDPALAANAGYQIVNKTKKGNYTHTLTTTESAPHTHAVNDPGHSHTYQKEKSVGHPSGTSQTLPRDPETVSTGTSTTGITLGNSGGGQPHNNTHPVIGGVFIMYIP